MAQQQQNVTIAAPGFMGVNSQESPITQGPQFCAIANNAVIDDYGRLGARKGYEVITTTKTELGTEYVTNIHQFIDTTGSAVIFSTGNNKILSGTTTLSNATPGAATITADDWQMATLNDECYFFQRGHAPLYYPNGLTAVDLVTAHASYAGTVPQGNCVVSAYGRLWVADVTNNKYTVYWSDLNKGYDWLNGSAGSLDITSVWPNDTDEITAIALHNNYLLIFGRECIIVYGSSASDGKLSDPANDLLLVDVVSGIGCIARKSIQSVGKDLLFLDRSGVRSFARVIQEKSLPIGDVSKNVSDQIKALIANEADQGLAYSLFSPEEAFYLVGFPSSQTVMCFDMRGALEDGSHRATIWPNYEFYAAHELQDGTIYLGNSDGISTYSSYSDNGSSYTFAYYSNPLNFGQPSTLKIPKQLDITLISGSGSATVFWGYNYATTYKSQTISLNSAGSESYYSVAEFSEDEFSGGTGLFKKRVNLTGTGTSVTIGFEAPINGAQLSIQEFNMQSLLGRIT